MKSLFLFSIILVLLGCATYKNHTQPIQSFTVSFYSPGNGINQEAKKAYDTFLTEKYAKLQFETILWGREGEIDYCFSSISLSEKNKTRFIQETNDLLSKYDRINIIENEECRKGLNLPK
ncbi:MAG TPA: hypothetical protein EYG86_02470 [Crocinitomicaceae bacterium]|nr:hypothetical protein [Crocinitomicaceae bacterium]